MRHPEPKPRRIRTTPSAVVASPSSPTAMPHPEPKPVEVIAKDVSPAGGLLRVRLATTISGRCGAETNANTTPSTGGVLGPEYLPGDVDGSLASNPNNASLPELKPSNAPDDCASGRCIPGQPTSTDIDPRGNSTADNLTNDTERAEGLIRHEPTRSSVTCAASSRPVRRSPRCLRLLSVSKRRRRRSTPRGGLLKYERVQAKRNELARKYAEYPKLVARLVDLFGSAKAVDEEVSRINGSAPPGEHRRLRRGRAYRARSWKLQHCRPADCQGSAAARLGAQRSDGLAAAPAVRPSLLRAGVVRPPLVGRMGAGTRRRPRHESWPLAGHFAETA